MVFTVKLNQIELQPGQNLIFHDINWHEFELLLEELGEHRGSRVSYYGGVLEIRMPLPEHEKAKILIGEFIKILFEELEINWEPFGSTTFRSQQMGAGIEPDDCFYVQNADLMIGDKRVDLSIDPPPDLALEIDVTSKTQLSAYVALGVPELWCYSDGKLQVLVLREGKYIEVKNSPIFGNLPVIEGILQFLQSSKLEGVAKAKRKFREWVRLQNIQPS